MPCCGCWWNGSQRHRPPDEDNGNPRNKCALQPGHSLMDWIRLGNSGRDLTGVGGRLRAVSPRELATHNITDDAWIAIRGRVYNVTHYLPYHPGGADELMRGAGQDATQLFDKVHPWVNYESLLAKCLVGPLRTELPEAAELFGSPQGKDKLQPSKAQELVRKSMENLANCITPVRKRIIRGAEDKSESSPSRVMQSLVHSSELPVNISRRAAAAGEGGKDQVAGEKVAADNSGNSPPVKVTPKPPPLRCDWIQTSNKLMLSVYTCALGNPGARARVREDGSLSLHVACGGARARLLLTPARPLACPLQLRVFPESGKVEVSARKAVNSVWRDAGTREWTGEVEARSVRAARVRARGRLTHDTVWLELEPRARDGTPVAMHVPVGQHIKIHHRVDGAEVVRSYTPVCAHWTGRERAAGRVDTDTWPRLHLVVKRYPRGAVSPALADAAEGDELLLSGPYGNFQLNRVRRARLVYLLAAGTGITPMLSLITFLLARSNPKCDMVFLMLFNKKEEDIILRDKLEELKASDERLMLTYILSEPDASWRGGFGRVDSEILHRNIPPDSLICCENCEHFLAACGPSEFTSLVQRLAHQRGLANQCFHGFLG